MARTVTIVTLCLLGSVAAAAAQTIESGPIRLKLGGRVQAQFNTTNVDEAELLAAGRVVASPIPASLFETRRVRFNIDMDFGDIVTGKLETELAMARLQLRDAFMNIGIHPAFQLRFGQYKKPFSWLQLTSSTRWPIIERALRVRGANDLLLAQDADSVLNVYRGNLVLGEEQYLLDQFLYQGYDIGAAVHGQWHQFSYAVGVFNGTGSDAVDDTNGKSFAGRASVRVLESGPLLVGAGFSTRETRLRTVPSILTRAGAAFEVDFQWGDFRKRGLQLLGEATTGTNLGTDNSFRAAQLVASWFQPTGHESIEGWEVAGRVSWGDPDDAIADDQGVLLTPGFNLYFSGRNRLQLNWDFYLLRNDQFTNLNALRAQAQVYF